MVNPRSQPTLLVFTLGAAMEERRRRLLPKALGGHERALHRRLLSAALEAGRGCGCRLLVSCPQDLALPPDATLLPQQGASFAERLGNALAAARRDSSGPVLVVGGDVPGLAAEHLRRALELLDDDPRALVLGPSPDGGVYLLASRLTLDGVVEEAAWCRRETRASLLLAAHRRDRGVHLLEPLLDLDRRRDLDRWLAHPVAAGERWRSLMTHLAALLAPFLRPLAAPAASFALRTAALPAFAGRAPPPALRSRRRAGSRRLAQP